MEKTVEWAQDIKDVNYSSTSGWSYLGSTEISYLLGDRGTFSIKYGLSILENDSFENESFYIIHYNQNAALNVDQDYRVSDIELKTYQNLTGINILDSDPGTTVGNSSYTVGVELGGSVPAGVSVSGGVSWEYNKPDVEIHNQSNYGQDIVHIYHNIAEDKPAGLGYDAEPGVELALSGGFGMFTDMHSITTCKVEYGWFDYDMYDNYIRNDFYVNVNINDRDIFIGDSSGM